jgi:hypothetical protein
VAEGRVEKVFVRVRDGAGWPRRCTCPRASSPTSYDVDLTVETWQDGEPFASRRWTRSIPRDLG